MYLSYYGLSLKPFQITSDPKFLWLGEKHKEALSTLRYGILDNKGFVLLTGEVGTGKTVLINQLVSNIEVDNIVATIPDPGLDSLDFFKLLAKSFKLNKTFMSKGGFLIHLRDFLHKSYANRQQVLLIIDEAQRLNHQLLEEIRLLSNIELHDRKLINIFFVGQTEFLKALTEPRNRALAQRISVKYNIDPLNESETTEFIKHRLQIAGANDSIFTEDAIKEVFAFSKGIPRLINIVCDHALLTGYATGKKKINAPIVKECAQELYIPVNTEEEQQELAQKLDQIKEEIIQELSLQAGSAMKAKTKAQVRTASEKLVALPTAARMGQNTATMVKNAGAGQFKMGGPKPSARLANRMVSSAGTQEPAEPAQSAVNWKSWGLPGILVGIAAVIVILGTIYNILPRFQQVETPRFDVEDLTPQKYKDSLERRKEDLQARMENGDFEETDISDSDPRQTIPAAAGMGSRSDATGSPAEASRAPTLAMGQKSLTPEEEQHLLNDTVRVLFDHNSNEIDPDALIKLDQIAAYLRDHPDQQVMVKGYTDDIGSEGYNRSVSQFRVNSVKSYLIGKGAPVNNIHTFALGPVDPIADNNTVEGRRLNRRVEIEFIVPTTN